MAIPPFPYDDEVEHFTKTWQQQLAGAISNLDDLCRYLQLPINNLPLSLAAAEQFSLRVPLSFAACIQKGNPNDPLLRQVLPIEHELQSHVGFTDDPVGDLAAVIEDGVLHKYHGRVLLISTGSCAINCRYCFRRNFPYQDQQLSKQKLHTALAVIEKDSSIREVILSGGDPLLLSDARLSNIITQLNAIPHVKRLRIHSRLPIVLPARIHDDFIAVLKQSRKPVVLVLHCNHANELNPRVADACAKLKQHGITLLNQSVLLSGVNDDATTLCQLSEHLFELGVLPYYLHLLDKATGTGHFAVDANRALQLLEQMQSRLSGYLVPKLVKEQAGAAFKEFVTAD